MNVIKLNEDEYKYALAATIERQSIINLNSFNDFEITHISKIEGYDGWDVIYQSGSTINLCEIKVRQKFLSMYNSFVIEQTKYDKLMELVNTEKAKKNNLQPIYMNFFFDGCVIWNLNQLEVEFKLMDMPNNSQNTKYIKAKPCASLNINDGYIIKYDTQFEERQKEAKTIMKFLFPNN